METVTINGIEYKFRCDSAHTEKQANSNSPALKIELQVLKDGEMVKWEDFKGSYAAEKICQYIRNTINGQRSFYWETNR